MKNSPCLWQTSLSPSFQFQPRGVQLYHYAVSMNFQFPDKGNKVGSYIIFIDSVLAFQCDTIMEVSAVMFPLEQHGFMIYVYM